MKRKQDDMERLTKIIDNGFNDFKKQFSEKFIESNKVALEEILVNTLDNISGTVENLDKKTDKEIRGTISNACDTALEKSDLAKNAEMKKFSEKLKEFLIEALTLIKDAVKAVFLKELGGYTKNTLDNALKGFIKNNKMKEVANNFVDKLNQKREERTQDAGHSRH
ncbi:MAG: hypothetical protein AB8B67_02305 [Rickettsiaceae bacterium]